MSAEPPRDTPDDAPATEDAATPSAAAPEPGARLRRWRPRLLRAGLALLGTGVVLRVALALALTPIVESQLGALGLPTTLEYHSLSLLSGTLELRGLDVSHGGAPLLHLDRLEADLNVRALVGGSVSFETIRVTGVRVDVRRDANGTLPLLLTLERQLAPGATAPIVSQTPTAPWLPPLSLGSLQVKEASLRFHDSATTPPSELEVNMELSLDDFVVSNGGPPARFHLRASAPSLVESVAVVGTASVGLGQSQLGARVSASGLTLRRLAPYLAAATLEPTLESGRLSLEIDASVTTPFSKPIGARLDVRALRLVDAEAALLGLDRLSVRAPHLDLAARTFELETLRASGAFARVGRSAAGLLSAAGLRTTPPATPASAKDSSTADAGSGRAGPVAPLPLLSVKHLLIGVRELVLEDAALERPLIVRELTLETKSVVRVGGPTPHSAPPIEARVTAEVAPVVSRVVVELVASPFAAERGVTLDVSLSGIQSQGVVTLLALPALERGDMSNGQLSVRLEARAHLEPDQTDKAHVELFIKDLSLRPTPDAPVVFGLDSLETTADVDLKALRVDVGVTRLVHPVARVVRRPDGLHALGFALVSKEIPALGATLERALGRAGSKALRRLEVQRGPVATDAPPPEAILERFEIEGLSLFIQDATVTPPATLPLSDLRFELLGASTRALSEPLPLTFSGSLQADAITLPDPERDGETERPAFEELTFSGTLRLTPAPNGEIKLTLSGAELSNMRGVSRAKGIDLRSGTLSVEATAQLSESGAVALESELRFVHLDASEPEGGLLSRTFGLSVPVKAVIFLLRDEDEVIEFGLPVELEPEGLSLSSALGAVARVLGRLIGRALLNAPLRPLFAMGDLGRSALGLVPGVEALFGGDTKGRQALTFQAGGATLSPTDRRALKVLINELRADEDLKLVVQHTLAAADIAAVESRVSLDGPTLDRLLARMGHVRQRIEIERRRAEVAARASSSEARSASLRAAETAAARLNDAWEHLLEEEREALGDSLPSATKHARKVRRGAVALGAARLLSVLGILEKAKIPRLSERLHVLTPTRRLDPKAPQRGRVLLVLKTG